MFLFLCNRIYCRRELNELFVPSRPVTAAVHTQSLAVVIGVAQKQSFPGVLEALETGDCHEIDAEKHGVKVKKVLTPLRNYCPFLCDGVMRIGCRLQKSEFLFDVKYPIVLPKRHVFTELIVLDAHIKCGRFAVNYVLNELLFKYHIVGGKSTVKHYLRKLCMD